MVEAETKSVADVLREARKLIEKPENWTQGASYRDENGKPVMGDDRGVCSRCMVGAISTVTGWDSDAALPVCDVLKPITGPFTDVWNDRPDRTHAEVLAAFDAAIARAEAQ